MTTYEHAMVGITGFMATGLQRKYGWQMVLIAGIAAMSPDWDALPYVIDHDMFERGHRVWGHNVLISLLVGIAIALSEYYFNWTTKLGRTFQRLFPQMMPPEHLIPKSDQATRSLFVLMAVCVVAACSHLFADLVVSGLGADHHGDEKHW